MPNSEELQKGIIAFGTGFFNGREFSD